MGSMLHEIPLLLGKKHYSGGYSVHGNRESERKGEMENLSTIIRICPIIQLVLRASGARSRAEDRGREPRNGTDDKKGRKEGRQR